METRSKMPYRLILLRVHLHGRLRESIPSQVARQGFHAPCWPSLLDSGFKIEDLHAKKHLAAALSTAVWYVSASVNHKTLLEEQVLDQRKETAYLRLPCFSKALNIQSPRQILQ